MMDTQISDSLEGLLIRKGWSNGRAGTRTGSNETTRNSESYTRMMRLGIAPKTVGAVQVRNENTRGAAIEARTLEVTAASRGYGREGCSGIRLVWVNPDMAK